MRAVLRKSFVAVGVLLVIAGVALSMFYADWGGEGVTRILGYFLLVVGAVAVLYGVLSKSDESLAGPLPERGFEPGVTGSWTCSNKTSLVCDWLEWCKGYE